jgi:hypothetical protein
MTEEQKFFLMQEYLQRMDYFVNEQDITYFATIIDLIDQHVYKN